MHDEITTTPPLPTHPDLVSFIFKNGIPSADSAGLLKFGLEALPGIRRLGFVGDRGIEITVDAEVIAMDRVWEVILNAGFAVEEVELLDRSQVVIPAEFEGGTLPSGLTFGDQTVAA